MGIGATTFAVDQWVSDPRSTGGTMDVPPTLLQNLQGLSQSSMVTNGRRVSPVKAPLFATPPTSLPRASFGVAA